MIGVSLVVWGVLLIVAQIAAGVLIFAFPDCVSTGLMSHGAIFLKFDYPDRLCVGIWGGLFVIFAGVVAILDRPAYKILAGLSLLCGTAVTALYVWGLIRIWNYRKDSGPWAQCMDIIQLTFVMRTVLVMLGVHVVAASLALLVRHGRHRLPPYDVASSMRNSTELLDRSVRRSRPSLYASHSAAGSVDGLDDTLERKCPA